MAGTAEHPEASVSVDLTLDGAGGPTLDLALGLVVDDPVGPAIGVADPVTLIPAQSRREVPQAVGLRLEPGGSDELPAALSTTTALGLAEQGTTQGPERTRGRRLAVVAAVAACLLLPAVGTGLVVAQRSTTVDATSPASLASLEQLRDNFAASASWSGTATYSLHGAGRAGTVTISRDGGSTRVDISTGAGRGAEQASLIGTRQGWVACTTATQVACLLVAPSGSPLPPMFDTGFQSLMTETLPALSARSVPVTLAPPIASADGAPQALCGWTKATDGGTSLAPLSSEYCVTRSGLLRRARSAGSDLELMSVTRKVDPAQFVPPVAPIAF